MRLTFFLIISGLYACTGKDDTTAADDSGATDDSGTTDDSGAGEDSNTTDDSGTGDDSGNTEDSWPDNAWYHAPDISAVPDEPGTDTWSVGSQVPNLRFIDQNGDEVWLYQFYGQTVYLDWVAEWCGPCNSYAPYIDAFYQEHSDDAVVLTVMLQDSSVAPGDAAAVSRWVEEHGSTNPIVWLGGAEFDRAYDASSFPTISLVDPSLRLAQENVNSLRDDAYIDQVIDRMVLAIGGSLDNDAEVCDNGYDDDLDLIADCMDPACASDSVCGSSEYTGSLAPCTPDPDELITTVDVWQVEVHSAVAAIEADGVSASTSFENVLYAWADDQDFEDYRVVGDDEWDCTWPLDTYGCARGWLRPGTWNFAVSVGTGGSDEYDGDCVDPDLGEYVLRIQGDVTMALVQDDVQRGDL